MTLKRKRTSVGPTKASLTKISRPEQAGSPRSAGKGVKSGAIGSPLDSRISGNTEDRNQPAVNTEPVPSKAVPKRAHSTPKKTIQWRPKVNDQTKSVDGVLDTVGSLHDDSGDIGKERQQLAQRIHAELNDVESSNGSDGSDESAAEEEKLSNAAKAPDATPGGDGPVNPDIQVKRGRGRPKGAKNKRLPTPPPDLPAHERYFYQNRSGGNQTSGNTLSAVSLLTHQTYHAAIARYTDRHDDNINDLHSLHARSFPQWKFELSQAFSICLYGYGSKRKLMRAFADYLHAHSGKENRPTTIFVYGDTPSFTLRRMLMVLASAVLSPSQLQRLPMQISELAASIKECLAGDPPLVPVYLIVHSLTSTVLAKPSAQELLADLSTIPCIHLIATADNPSFPILWDSTLRARFNWVFHDATTFVSYDDGHGTGEIPGIVDSVHELIGRKGLDGKGREGLRWVLRSLPDNAKSLYRVLLAEILAASMDEFGASAGPTYSDDGSEADELFSARQRRPQKNEEELPGIEYKRLYEKAVEEFICSSEMAFRTLLKEFYDHQMITSRHDGAGMELLGVPMRKEDVEGVLEDLME